MSRIAPSRFDAGTVYATIDDHRQNNYETYIYASKDYGQTWTSLNGNLKGEAIKTITEDTKNPDVLYRRRRDGTVRLHGSRRLVVAAEVEPADRPRRRDRHPSARQRDGAGTHGRAIWVLDHIEPIQEYAAAQNTEAKLFSPPPSSMFRRPARDRNYEFWGNQVFYGENPPQAAVLSYFVKNKPNDVKLKITDATGREVREIAVPAASLKAGIDAACWDLRVQPIPAPHFPGARRGGQGTRRHSERAGGALRLSAAGGAGGGGGGGGFGGGGGGNPGPYVLAGQLQRRARSSTARRWRPSRCA